MTTSHMFAQVLGIFFSVLGLGCILNKEHVDKAMSAIIRNHAIQFVATLMPLIFGAFIVVLHHHWVSNWTVLVTIVGWLILLAGVFRAIFPAVWINRVKVCQKKANLNVIGGVVFILGVVFLFCGFMK